MAFDFDDLEGQDPTKEVKEPVLVAWYSGGFTPQEGQALLADLFGSVKAEFPGIETLALNYPNEYGLFGLGPDKWPAYMDRCVEEINKEPSRASRPIIIFGHSVGYASALSLAARLGDRCKKVYVASTPGPERGKENPLKLLSEEFQKTGEKGLLGWLVVLQPGNRILEDCAKAVWQGEMKIEDSKFLAEKIHLMRVQYMDAIWPDMERDFKGITAPIIAFGPRNDQQCTREGLENFFDWTEDREHSRVKMLTGVGHMDCLRKVKVDGVEVCDLIEDIVRDIASVRTSLGL